MMDILLLLSHYPYSERTRDSLAQLLSNVQDWPALVNLINAHGIIALAAYNIKEAGLENIVPVDSMALLENGMLKSMTRNAWLAERWKEVNTILENAGIKHILLKGMALEHTMYGSRGLRQMADNDILIERDDSIKAWILLQKNGFTPELLKSKLHKKIILDMGKHLPTLVKDGYSLEIHTRLFELNDELNQKAFSETAEIYIENTRALVLSGTVLHEYLISHFKRHLSEGTCQFRLFNDLILLNIRGTIEFPEKFIMNPIQGHKRAYKREAYRATVKAVPPRFRIKFIVGDIFPSMNWMKKRYKCGRVFALLSYLPRIGKLRWLV